MDFLTEIIIKNFQSHKHTVLPLTSGFNVIRGQTRSGKTAIIRALNWLLNNRPQGFKFKSTFATPAQQTRVVIKTDSGSVIERIRDENANCYLLAGKKFEALKGDVPKAIIDELNITDINFQTQHEGFFLLQDSAGDVARKFSKLVNLDIIDKCIKCVNKIINDYDSKKQVAEEYIEKSKDLLAPYASIDEQEKELTALEVQQAEYQNLKAEFEQLQTLCLNATTQRERVEFWSQWLKCEQSYLSLNSDIQEYNKQAQDYKNGVEFYNLCCTQKQKVEAYTDWLSVEGPHSIIEKDIEQYKKLSVEAVDLKRSIDSVILSQNLLNKIEKELQRDIEMLQKSFPATCPLCGQPVGEN